MSAEILRLVKPWTPAVIIGGFIHVRRQVNGMLRVEHESASGESFATLANYPPDQKLWAVQLAVDSLVEYAPCNVGTVDL